MGVLLRGWDRFSLRVAPCDGNSVIHKEYGSPVYRERFKALPADKDHLKARS
jgi:hypothetical protein